MFHLIQGCRPDLSGLTPGYYLSRLQRDEWMTVRSKQMHAVTWSGCYRSSYW